MTAIISSPTVAERLSGAASDGRPTPGLLSVVVVSYNGCELLRACLESLRDEADRIALEVIVVDNASSDGAVGMIRAEHPWVRLIESGANVGFARASNHGIEQARGEYILLLNPDTVVPPNALAQCLQEMGRRPDVAVLGCKLVLPDGSIDHACKRSFPTPLSALAYMTKVSRLPLARRLPWAPLTSQGYTAPHLGDDETGTVDAVNGAFMLVRSSAIAVVGPLDEGYWMYGEDLDWCRRFWSAGWKVLYWPHVSVTHVKGGSAGRHRGWRTNFAFHRAMWLFYRAHVSDGYPRALHPAVWSGIWLKFALSTARSATARASARTRRVSGRRPPRTGNAGRLRVLAVLPSLDAGGAERHAVTVYPALDRRRFDVRLVCIKGRGPLRAEARRAGLPVATLDAGDANLGIVASLVPLLRVMRAHRPDVVITAGFSADLLGRVAARVTGTRAVLSWKHNCGHTGPYGRRERRMERALGAVTTRYLAVAHSQVPYLTGYLDLPAAKIEVIRNSVEVPAIHLNDRERDERRADLGLNAEQPVIGVVAALRAWKGHATLLRAFRLVLEAESDACLLVLGDGEERDSLLLLAAELGISERVQFLGDRRDVGELLPIVDVVALASYSVECLPYAILEAMSHSRPAVATAIGGMAELIEDGVTGLLVKPRDERALAAALLTILRSPDRGRSMGRAGFRRLVDHFPFDSTVRRIEMAVESAVARAASR